MATPLRNVRVPDELWNAAKDKAASGGTNLTSLIVEFLNDYVNGSEQTKRPRKPEASLDAIAAILAEHYERKK